MRPSSAAFITSIAESSFQYTQVVALHVALIGRAERKRDLTIGRRIDLLPVERLQIGDRFCQAP